MLLFRKPDSIYPPDVLLPNYDLHNHTIFCGHADDNATIENLIARANELRLTSWASVNI